MIWVSPSCFNTRGWLVAKGFMAQCPLGTKIRAKHQIAFIPQKGMLKPFFTINTIKSRKQSSGKNATWIPIQI